MRRRTDRFGPSGPHATWSFGRNLVTMRGRGLLVALLLFVLASACGTRVDRDEFSASLRAAGSSSGTDQLAASDTGSSGGDTLAGPVAATPSGGSGASTARRSGSSGGGGGCGGGSTGSGGTGGGGGSGADVAQRLGVSDEVVGDTITIGMHVPITGAAPIPDDFMDTIRVIEEYINKEAPIAGKKVKFVVEDDGYDAQVGLAACKKLVDSKPLLVIGHTMPAAEGACADEFNKQKVPYFMRGTFPDALKDRPLAWFGTISDERQGVLLADYVLNQLGGVGKKVGVVFQNDQIAAKNSFIEHLEAGGADVVVVDEVVPKQPDFSPTVQKLQTAGVDFVLLSLPPVDTIKLSTQAQGQGYHPTWLGGGTWWNYNMVLESAGMALDGSVVLSPWASIDSAATDEFKDVYRRYRPNGEPQDIGLIMWGWSQLVREAVERVPADHISRASLVAAMDGFEFQKPYWHPVSYTADDHRGADSVVVMRADGQARRWRQVTGFTSSL